MKKILKIGGFLVAGFGILILLKGNNSGVVPGIIFTLLGVALIAFSQFSGEVSKKYARKELMELKSLLDNGILTNDEYEEKAKALKNKI